MSPRALKLLAVADHAGRARRRRWRSRCGPRLSALPGPARPERQRRPSWCCRAAPASTRSPARLDAAGVIERPWLFRLAVRLGRTARSRPASTPSRPAATPASVINMLARGETVARRLTVAEGLTVAEVFRLLADDRGLSGELPEPPPEGSLLPETYFYALGDQRAELVRRMQRGMRRLLDELWPARADALPLDRPRGGADPRLDRRQGDRRGGRSAARSPRCSSTGCAAACGCSPIRP